VTISIRRETGSDHREVEELTREAFWNLHVPGCNEHYLVYKMRTHPDFIPELDFVATLGNRIVGNIMYTKSQVVDELDGSILTATFGPISVLPGHQRKGIGSALISHTKPLVQKMGYKAIIIYGHPQNYCKHGFKGSKDFEIGNAEGKYPYSLLVLELEAGIFLGHQWRYLESDVYNIDAVAAEEFDRLYTPKEKGYQYSQEEFHIASRAYVH
jgi:putative acetyltransferase